MSELPPDWKRWVEAFREEEKKIPRMKTPNLHGLVRNINRRLPTVAGDRMIYGAMESIREVAKQEIARRKNLVDTFGSTYEHLRNVRACETSRLNRDYVALRKLSKVSGYLPELKRRVDAEKEKVRKELQRRKDAGDNAARPDKDK